MAAADSSIEFGPFRADMSAQCLRRGTTVMNLRPKTWGVLRYLIENPGRLVTKDELLAQVWLGTIVTEGTLTQSIRELRTVLDDDSKRPRFIATVHRRGYRFIAEIGAASSASQPSTAVEPPASTLFGREPQMAQLQEALTATLSGQRRSLFITGDAGIGKTTLLEAFLRSATPLRDGELVVARGQCIEQRGESEPYLPVLEALHQLCRGTHKSRVLEVLRRYAPTCLVQMPWLLAADDLEGLRQQLLGTGSERMLRELTVALAELAAQVPLAIVIEDLHWCDLATVDLLAALARRRDQVPLLLIGTLRAATAGARRHSFEDLLPSLTSRGSAIEIALGVLDSDAVRDCVMSRLDGRAPAAFVDAIQRHSGGSPLFVVTALAYALAQGWIVRGGEAWQLTIAPEELEATIPAGLRQLIEVQVAGLDRDERTLLEAASVAGIEVSSRSLAVALDRPVHEIEAALDLLSRRYRFIRRVTTDHEVAATTARFELSHALYQQVLYNGAAPALRRRLHLEVARGLEVDCGDRAPEMAAELALHFERGGAYDEAVRYLGLAALNAHARGANREAAALIESALKLIAQLEDSPRRKRREADLWIQLGAVRGSIFGRGADQYLPPFLRAWELSQEIDDVPRMFLARMAGFGHFSLTEQLGSAEEVCHDLIALAARVPMPDLVAVANAAMGSVLCGKGELEKARQHLERALTTLNPHDPSTKLFRRLEDPEILCLTGLAWVLAQLGFPDQARRRCAEAIALGRERAPYHHVYCQNAAAILDLFLDDPASCLRNAESTLALAREHGFDGFLGNATLLASWGRERVSPSAGAWRRLQQDVDVYRRCTQRFGLVAYQALVAEAALAEGAIEDGLAAVSTAEEMMRSSGELAPAANLLRIRALLLAASAAEDGEVEKMFFSAVSVAHGRGAKLYELRAATELARWCRQRGESKRARDLLAPIQGWFTEGFDAPDLQRARSLLAELERS